MTLRMAVICGSVVLTFGTMQVRAASNVKMPFMKGETMTCSQGNAACDPTHCRDGAMEFAWDFGLTGAPCGDCDIGIPVVAGADGRVVYAQDYASGLDDWGKCVILDYDDGASDNGLHAHLDQIFVKVGEYVKQGQVIGTLGNASGRYSNAAHLHFQRETGETPNGWSISSEFADVGVPLQGQSYASQNSNIIDLRKNAALNNTNSYGWSQSPVTLCGSNFGSIYWWHGFDPDDLYFTDHTSKRCYVSVNDNNNQPDGGIVYDALGGARQAFFVGWANEWDKWEVLDISCGSCPNPSGTGGNGQGGPQSCLGMPITNRYEESSNHWRQDFQKGYIVDGSIYCYGVVNNFNTYAPGWVQSYGWNNQYSYLITDCYDRNGARVGVGCALQEVHENWNETAYSTQRYDFGTHDQGMIVYDPASWEDKWTEHPGNNLAYYVYGSFYAYWSTVTLPDGHTLRWYLGAPTTDRVGNTQYFKYGKMVDDNGVIRTYLRNNDPLWNSLHGVVIEGGGGNGDSQTPTLTLITGPGQMVMKDHLTYSFSYGGEIYFTTHYPVYGGDYGNMDSRVKIYRNGDEVWCSKDGNVIYCDGTYSSSDFYEADYPRKAGSITYSYTYNGVPTFTAPSHIVGGTWGDSHSGVSTFKNGTWIRGYKETGSALLVTPDDAYVSGATYTAFYPTDADTSIRGYVSMGPGQMVYKEKLTFSDSSGNVVWFTTHWPVAGGDYSQTDARVKIYCNGVQVGSGKEGYRLYSTEGYNSAFSYEADYPRTPTTLTVGYLYNGYRAFYAPSQVWGGTWGNTHAALKVYRNGTQIEAYKEVGTTVIVIDEDDYVAGATYTAEYPECWNTGSSKLVVHDGNDQSATLPLTFSLGQNYPNPFNPVTTIAYTLPSATQVSLDVFNILGQKVASLVNEKQEAGPHSAHWNAEHYSSGVYFYRLVTDQAVATKKMLLLK